MTQNEAILAHLKAGNSITGLECLKMRLGIRLASRINELRSEGHNIQDEWIEQDGMRFKKYFLAPGLSKSISSSQFQTQGVLLDAPTLAPNFDY